MSGCAHVLVLNHNGRALLEECLPSVVSCARSSATPCRVTVIDNASTDESVTWLARHWPEVGILPMPNQCLVSFNEAVRQLPEPIVLLLNNDVKLGLGCIDRLTQTVEQHEDCLLAGPHCWTFDGRYEGTRSSLHFERGLVRTRLDPPHDGDPVGGPVIPTASAGAVLAVNREKFLALGGFDPLFLPGRYEDLDLAFRGWMAGWRAYYVPQAVAYHLGSATFGRTGSHRELDVRNALLFAWKNLREPRHLIEHALFLGLRVAWAIVTGEQSVLHGCAAAVRRLPAAVRRNSATRPRIRSEREVFELLKASNA